MTSGGYWAIRTWVAGPVGEKVKYWVPGERPTRSQRRLAEEARKRLQNEQSAERRVARLLNANFSWRNLDCLVGLDYSEEGLDKLRAAIPDLDSLTEGSAMDALWLAAEHEMELAIRRVQRAAGKRGVAVRYLAVTSDMDGKTGEAVRVHHHLVINREAAALLKETWKLGGTHVDGLDTDRDYTALAHYLMVQARRIEEKKKYKPSRNLRRPEPKDRIALSEAELRVPRGAELLYRGPYIPGRPQYIRYYKGPTGDG